MRYKKKTNQLSGWVYDPYDKTFKQRNTHKNKNFGQQKPSPWIQEM